MQLRFTQSMKVIAGTLLLTFIIQQTADQFFGQTIGMWLSLHGVQSNALTLRFLQLFTYTIVHHDPITLCFNILGIIYFGVEMETLWGTKLFWAFIAISVLGIGILFLVASSFVDLAPLQGASGVFYSFLSAYAILFGERTFLLLGIFPMKTRQFIGLLILVATLSVLFSPQGRGTGLVHLSGVCMGALSLGAIFALKRMQFSQKKGKKKQNNLKLVVNKKNSTDDNNDPKKPTWH